MKRGRPHTRPSLPAAGQSPTSNLDHPIVKKWLETLKAMMTEDKSTPPLGEQLTSKMPIEQEFCCVQGRGSGCGA